MVLNERAVAARAWSPGPDDWPFDHVAISHSPVFDLWIGELPPRAPHVSTGEHSSVSGKWIMNPLYVRESERAYVRHFANPQYQEEFSELTSLLPEEVRIDAAGDETPFDPELSRRRIILFVPERY
jgi:hypothetical protein